MIKKKLNISFVSFVSFGRSYTSYLCNVWTTFDAYHVYIKLKTRVTWDQQPLPCSAPTHENELTYSFKKVRSNYTNAYNCYILYFCFLSDYFIYISEHE